MNLYESYDSVKLENDKTHEPLRKDTHTHTITSIRQRRMNLYESYDSVKLDHDKDARTSTKDTHAR